MADFDFEEADAGPMQIALSEETYELIPDEFSCVDLGEHEIKGFGTQRVYSLEDDRARR